MITQIISLESTDSWLKLWCVGLFNDFRVTCISFCRFWAAPQIVPNLMDNSLIGTNCRSHKVIRISDLISYLRLPPFFTTIHHFFLKLPWLFPCCKTIFPHEESKRKRLFSENIINEGGPISVAPSHSSVLRRSHSLGIIWTLAQAWEAAAGRPQISTSLGQSQSDWGSIGDSRLSRAFISCTLLPLH